MRKKPELLVSTNCQHCGKAFIVNKNRLLDGRGKFCSKTCFDTFRRGKPRPNSKLIKCSCQICGKEFHVYPYKIKDKRGKYCSPECYFKSKIGKPSWKRGLKLKEIMSPERFNLYFERKSRAMKGRITWMKGKKMKDAMSPERYESYIKEVNARLLDRLEYGKYPKLTNTRPERRLREELEQRGLKEGLNFIHQYKLYDKFLCDFVFLKERLIVECDGDYWHVNPAKYAGKPLSSAQRRTSARDRSKEGYIRKIDGGSWRLLRFWESDIKKDVKRCADEIEATLKARAPSFLID